MTVLRRRRPGYPGRLLELHDPPAELHLCGGHPELLAWERPVVAIVGSRRAGEAGLGMARELARGAAAAGALVVSGLALGVDAAAHEGALAAGAPTLAVLGSGPDVAYPRTNRGLYARILAAGLIVSEYPPGTEPAPWRFPARNRLIAALADAVVVVEAKVRSGALITADHALDLGRDVLAVPGWPAFSGAGGTNALLKAGAGLIESVEDLNGWLGLEVPASRAHRRRSGAGRAARPAGLSGRAVGPAAPLAGRAVRRARPARAGRRDLPRRPRPVDAGIGGAGAVGLRPWRSGGRPGTATAP